MRNEIHEGSILIISHQERILNIADEIIVLRSGQVVAQGQKKDVLPTLLGTADATPECRKAGAAKGGEGAC